MESIKLYQLKECTCFAGDSGSLACAPRYDAAITVERGHRMNNKARQIDCTSHHAEAKATKHGLGTSDGHIDRDLALKRYGRHE